MTDMMELADKGLTVDIIKIINMLMDLKEGLNLMRRETEGIKRTKENIAR